MLGKERLGVTIDLVFVGTVKVTGGDGAVRFGQSGKSASWEMVQRITIWTSPMAWIPQ